MNFFKKFKTLIGWEKVFVEPEFDLDSEIYAQLKPFRFPLILIQLIMIIGTLGYIYLEDYSIMHAIFQAAYTFSTTGFGALNERNFSNAGIVFTVTLILGGFVALTFSVGVLIDVINKGKLFGLIKERNMLYKIARLRKHYVVFYHNEYTIELTKEFRENHIPFVVVDPSPNIEEISVEYKYPYFVQEEPFTERAFLKSHLSSAKAIISLSKNISDNITLISSARLYEKELGRRPFLIICNAENQKDIDKLTKLGADKVVAPPKLMASRMSAMAVRPEMESVLEELLYKKDTPIDMEEIFVPVNSWLVNNKLKEAHLRDIINVSVVGIRPKFGAFLSMPKGDTVVSEECKLLVVGTPHGISRAKKIVRQSQRPKELSDV